MGQTSFLISIFSGALNNYDFLSFLVFIFSGKLNIYDFLSFHTFGAILDPLIFFIFSFLTLSMHARAWCNCPLVRLSVSLPLSDFRDS